MMSEMSKHEERLLVGLLSLIALIFGSVLVWWVYQNRLEVFKYVSAIIIAVVLSYSLGTGLIGAYQNYKSHKD